MGIVSITILAASIAVTLMELGIFGNNAQGQGNVTIGNVTLTPQQKAAICDPNNPKLNFVNSTESELCGIPKTIKNVTSTTTAANMTTGAEEGEPPSSTTSIAPSVVPTPP
jgi:hypothetical protein